jgi:hypothetical protein
MAPFTSPTTPTLYWNVAALARARGIKSVPALSALVGAHRQSLYKVVKNTAENVSVDMLARIALKLGPTPDQRANPGEWFVWDGDQLRWDIARLSAERLGITTMSKFSLVAGVYPRMIAKYWENAEDPSKFVFVETLAKLAQAFIKNGQPFDVGDLFSWQPPSVTSLGEGDGEALRPQKEGSRLEMLAGVP